MQNEIIQIIDQANHISPYFGSIVENGITYGPYIVGGLNFVKSKRFQMRMEKNKVQVEKLSTLYSETSLPMEYINEKIGPVAIADLVEEHEDAKINYILNGFQNVFIEEKYYEGIVYNYFDTLRSLRYADIRRLFYYAELDEVYPNVNYHLGSEVDGYVRSIDYKLEKLGLINVNRTLRESWGEEDVKTRQDITILTYGRMFIEFIS